MSIKKGTTNIAGIPTGLIATVNSKADANNVYSKTESDNLLNNMLEALYPVGSLYIAVTSTCPLATLIPNSQWTLVSQDRVLQGAGDRGTVGSNLAQGLPQISGSATLTCDGGSVGIISSASGALQATSSSTGSAGKTSNNSRYKTVNFSAKNSNSIYGASTNVQPSAYLVNIWQRTA